jgi:hypothetical protein
MDPFSVHAEQRMQWVREGIGMEDRPRGPVISDTGIFRQQLPIDGRKEGYVEAHGPYSISQDNEPLP